MVQRFPPISDSNDSRGQRNIGNETLGCTVSYFSPPLLNNRHIGPINQQGKGSVSQGLLMTPAPAPRTKEAYWQRFLKYPRLSLFESRSELLHAALLEGDPAVSAFVPHPFRLRAAARGFSGCYLRRDGIRVARVIAAHDALSDALQSSLREFFASHRMYFEVISEQAILTRETEARNWLYIVRRLIETNMLDTTARETLLLRRMRSYGEKTLVELIGNPIRTRDEIALFRLLHRGALRARLDREPLNANTRLDLPR